MRVDGKDTAWAEKGRTMEDNKAEGISLNIDHDPQTRRGCFSDLAMAATNGPNTRLDFISTDIPDENGNIRGVLSARVYMSNESLIALRDMLNSHTEGWEVTAHGDAE